MFLLKINTCHVIIPNSVPPWLPSHVVPRARQQPVFVCWQPGFSWKWHRKIDDFADVFFTFVGSILNYIFICSNKLMTFCLLSILASHFSRCWFFWGVPEIWWLPFGPVVCSFQETWSAKRSRVLRMKERKSEPPAAAPTSLHVSWTGLGASNGRCMGRSECFAILM